MVFLSFVWEGLKGSTVRRGVPASYMLFFVLVYHKTTSINKLQYIRTENKFVKMLNSLDIAKRSFLIAVNSDVVLIDCQP